MDIEKLVLRFCMAVFLVVVFSLAISESKAAAYDRWFMNTMVVADWLQTRDIEESPEFTESKPWLGPNPTTEEVNQHFISMLLIYNAAYELIPYRQGKFALSISIGLIHADAVKHNKSIGVSIHF